jgi:hypothetical protein
MKVAIDEDHQARPDAPQHDLAWDSATGNGQAAIVLNPFFRIPARLDITSDVRRFEPSCPSSRLAVLDSSESNDQA